MSGDSLICKVVKVRLKHILYLWYANNVVSVFSRSSQFIRQSVRDTGFFFVQNHRFWNLLLIGLLLPVSFVDFIGNVQFESGVRIGYAVFAVLILIPIMKPRFLKIWSLLTASVLLTLTGIIRFWVGVPQANQYLLSLTHRPPESFPRTLEVLSLLFTATSWLGFLLPGSIILFTVASPFSGIVASWISSTTRPSHTNWWYQKALTVLALDSADLPVPALAAFLLIFSRCLSFMAIPGLIFQLISLPFVKNNIDPWVEQSLYSEYLLPPASCLPKPESGIRVLFTTDGVWSAAQPRDDGFDFHGTACQPPK